MGEIMIDLVDPPGPPPEWQAAKETLDKAVEELSRVSQGTSLQFTLPMQVMIIQLDTAIEMLANQGLLNRSEFFERIQKSVEQMTSEIRRAILASGAQQQHLIKPS